jgi:hypothetical protein
MNAEPNWLSYLHNRFPGEQIEVLNFFSTRSVNELKEIFKNVDYITFSTTFTSTQWFKNLIEASTDTNKIIGLSHTGWDIIDTEYVGTKLNIERINY